MTSHKDTPAATKSEVRPLRRDAERNRKRILEGAEAAFAERGLQVSMDEIAQRTGVGVATVYRHFPTKGQLVDALLEDTLAEYVLVGEEALEKDDPWEALVSFIEYGMRTQSENRAFEDIALGSPHSYDHFQVLSPIADKLVRRAQEAGRLRPEIRGTDIPLLQVMVGALVDFTRGVDPEVWRRGFAIIIDGLRTGGEAPAGEALDPEQVEAAMRRWTPSRRN